MSMSLTIFKELEAIHKTINTYCENENWQALKENVELRHQFIIEYLKLPQSPDVIKQIFDFVQQSDRLVFDKISNYKRTQHDAHQALKNHEVALSNYFSCEIME